MTKQPKVLYYFFLALIIFLWACNSTRLNVTPPSGEELSTLIFTEMPEEAAVATEHSIQTQNALTQAVLPTLTSTPPVADLPTLTAIPNSTPAGVGAFLNVAPNVLGSKYEILNAYYFDILENGERYEIYAGALAGFSNEDTAQGVAVLRVLRVIELNGQPSIDVVATNEFLTTNKEYDLFPVGPVIIDENSIPQTKDGSFLLRSISQDFSWIFVPAQSYMVINPEPPHATLEVNGQKQIAGLGGYCWLNSCLDGTAISTNSMPIVAQTSSAIHLHLPLVDPPNKLALSTMWISPPGKPEYDEFHGDQEQAIWYFNRPIIALGDLPLRREQDLKLSLEPGFYVLILDATWKEYGDVSYGLFIEVQE